MKLSKTSLIPIPFRISISTLLLIGCMGLSLLLSWHAAHYFECFGQGDSFHYLAGGESLLHGKGYLDPDGQPQTIFVPLFSFCIALLHAVIPDLILSGILVSVIASSLSLVPLFILTKRWLSESTALFVVLLFAIHPSRIWISGLVMTEACQSLCLLLIVVTYFRSLDSKPYLVAFGILVGLGYFLREENLLVLLPIAVNEFWICKQPWSQRVGRFLTILAITVLIVLPWVIRLHHFTGRWMLVGKGEMTLRHYGIQQYKHGDGAGVELSPDGTQIIQSATESISVSENSKRIVGNERKVISILAHLMGASWKTVAVFLWGLFYFLRRTKGSAEQWIFATIYLLPLLGVFPIFHIQQRYVVPYLPFFIIGIAVGLEQLRKSLQKITGRSILATGITGLLLLSMLNPYVNLYQGYVNSGRGRELRGRMALWMQQRHLPQGTLMGIMPREISFLTGFPLFFLPSTIDFDHAVHLAQAQKVRYWVVTTMDRITEATAPVLAPDFYDPRLIKLHEIFTEGHKIALYEVHASNFILPAKVK